MSGDTLRIYSHKGWTDRQVVNVRTDWDVLTCLMTVRHKRLTGAVTRLRVDLAIDYYNTNLKVEPLANKVTRTKEIEV